MNNRRICLGVVCHLFEISLCMLQKIGALQPLIHDYPTLKVDVPFPPDV